LIGDGVVTTIKVINESGEKASFGAKVMIGKTDRCLRSTGNVADLKFARAFNDRGRGSREEAMPRVAAVLAHGRLCSIFPDHFISTFELNSVQ
jgi:hypothetical protein